MTTLNNTFESIPGLIDAVTAGKINVIPLTYNSKKPFDNGWTSKDYDIEQLLKHSGNLGILINENFAAIDIDGTIDKNNSANVKSESRGYLAKILFKAFPDAIHVRTASGGYHLYFKSSQEFEDAHEVSKTFCFPRDFEVKELRGQPLNNAIEVFTKHNKRQVVAPGSVINNNKYQILSSGCQNILDLPTYDNVNEKLREVLILNNFTEQAEEIALTDDLSDVNIHIIHESHTIPNYHVQKLAEFFVELFKLIDGQKHYATLQLGGYFARHIDVESAKKIGYEMAKSGIFKNDNLFIQTLLKSYGKDEENNDLSGGNKLYEDHFSDFISKEEFYGKLIFYTGSSFEFYPSGRRGKSFKKIFINQHRKRVDMISCAIKQQDDEYIEVERSSESCIGYIPIRIEEIFNPLLPAAPPRLVIDFVNISNERYPIEGQTMSEIIAKFRELPGAVTGNAYNTALNQIIMRFRELNMIDVSKKSSVPGIFEINGEMRRYDTDGTPMVIRNADPGDALQLLDDIRRIVPWSDEDFGNIVRIGLLFPFTHILRQYGHAVNYLVMAGSGGVLKTTIAEMILSFYAPVKRVGKNAVNEFGGGAFSSPWQVGEKFGRSGNGFIVNEPGVAFNDPDLLEILKDAIESDMARVTQEKDYPSYQSAIFCANIDIPSTSSFIRRCETFMFSPENRATPDVLDNLGKLLNVKGVKNKKFALLRPIGDFVTYLLATNLHWLEEYTLDDLRSKMIDELQKNTNVNLQWMRLTSFDLEETLEDDVTDVILDTFKQYLTQVYNKTFKIMDNQIISSDGVLTGVNALAFDANKVRILIQHNSYAFLEYTRDDNIFAPQGIMKKWYKNQHNMVVSGKAFYDRIKEYEGAYDITFGKFRITKEKRKRGIKMSLDFIVDLMNNKLEDCDE